VTLDDADQSQSPTHLMSDTRRQSQRGRIIAVGKDAATAIEDATNRPINEVPSFYDAIGELAITELRSAPDAIVCTPGSLSIDTPETQSENDKNQTIESGHAVELAAAVRRVDPSVCLLVIADPDQVDLAVDAIADGFDTYLTTPVSRIEFERAVNESVRMAGHNKETNHPPTQPPHRKQESQPDPKEAAPTNDEPETDESPADAPTESAPTIEPTEHENTVQDKPTQTKSPLDDFQIDEAPVSNEALDNISPAATEQPSRPIPNEVSDIDLVHELLKPRPDIRPLLLQVIKENTGLHNLTLSDHPQSDAFSQPITPEPTDRDNPDNVPPLAYLNSPESDTNEKTLTPWTQWLAYWLKLERKITTLRQMAYTDDLTGAKNRRFFNEYLSTALADAKQQRQFLTLLLFDIDDFKQYNDRYGHTAGDDILIEMVRLLKSVIRPNDHVCRLGGDEFAVIFYDRNGERSAGSRHPEDIHEIARRFQEQIQQHRFPKLAGDAPGQLTISGGLATYPWDGHDLASLIQCADESTLNAKKTGKNAIILGPNM